MLEMLTSRRAFLRNIAMATAAGVAGYIVGRTSGLTKPKTPGTEPNGYGPSSGGSTYLAPASAVPPHGGGLILASDHVVLVMEANGQLKAFSSTCTHQGCTVASVVNGVIQCPCHGSQFSAVNGDVIQGPATRPLPPVAISVHNGYATHDLASADEYGTYEESLMHWWRTVPTWMWMTATAFAVGALIALS